MAVRVFSGAAGADGHAVGRTTYEDSSFDQRETTVNGYTFHWGINETRNFLDDGVGLAHAAFKDADSDAIVQYTIPFGSSRA